MFLGNLSLPPRDKEGRYFLDRNGDSFKVVLEYLRTGKIFPVASVSIDQVRAEFDYFGLDYKQEEHANAPRKNPLRFQFDTSVVPVWIRNVLMPFVLNKKKAPFYTEQTPQLKKFFFNLRGKLGNYISDSFYKIQESEEGYLAYNAHNIDISRYLMDLIRDFVLRNDESREIFRESILTLGNFTHVSFSLYTEQINDVDTHTISITAFI